MNPRRRAEVARPRGVDCFVSVAGLALATPFSPPGFPGLICVSRNDRGGEAAVVVGAGLTSRRGQRRIPPHRSSRAIPGDRLDIENLDDVIRVRGQLRRQAAEVGFPLTDQALLAAVLTELARNIVDYAGRGEVLLRRIESADRIGVEILARDHGPGIPNIGETLRASYSVAGGLGLGLRGIKGLMDTLDIVSVPGKGTTVTARKWLS